MGHPLRYDKTNKMFAYMRIGLYWVMKGHEQSYNFCDVHQLFPNEGVSHIYHSPFSNKLFYTDPRGSIDGIKTFDRSSLYNNIYVKNDGSPIRELDLENGGEASALWMKKARTYDLWLFGPLVFLGAPYGTLLVVLEGFQPPVILTKWRKPPLGPEYEVTWPTGNSQFHPCTIYGNAFSDYPLGAEHPNKTGWRFLTFNHHLQEIGDLTAVTKDLHPVRLPDFAQSAAWKVEAYSGSATQYECYNQHG
jgi:hypothetical protein